MTSVDDLLAALEGENFDTALDNVMGSLDKDGLSNLKNEMNSRAAGIPDPDKRHLFKNGIASIEMYMQAM